MRLYLHYPRSFTTLLLLAFAFVALPLLGGMINTAYLLGDIVSEGRDSVVTTVKVTRATRQLIDGVSTLQRAVGQFQVLQDPGLRQAVVDAHRGLQYTISTIGNFALEAGERTRLVEIGAAEQVLFGAARREEGTTEERLAALAPRFDELHSLALEMATDGNRIIDRQTAAMEKTAHTARRTLFLQVAAMVPLSLFLALFFSWQINRPVRQLSASIRRLGELNLAPGPAVNGPRDLVYLGEQLDWLRRRLIDLEAQQVHFLRHVSHELKTPLAALREGVELLADRVGGELSGRQEEITRIMRGNARELQRRIEDLVRYSRVIQEPEPLVLAPLDLDELLAAVLRRHDLAIRARGLRINRRTKGIRFMADRAKIATVFDNLLSNAIRFSPPGGVLEVTAHAAKHATEILVCDQGPGVPEPDRPFIFQPFYQGSITPAGPVRGSGLGLSIVKEYVEAHGGRIGLQENPPWGACFRLELPISEGGGK
jgi:two-component system sensor histidine kinase GlrK